MDKDIWIYWLGPGIGILGGIVGTAVSIRQCKGPRERTYMTKVSLGFGLFVTLFLVAMFLTPYPYRAYLWGPYIFLLLSAIARCNKKQDKIRHEEQP